MLKYLLSKIPEEPARNSVLLIDDDPTLRQLTVAVLAKRGFGRIYEAATGGAGLARARELRPDVILLDLELPGISGETVLHLLRADPWTRGIPVVLFTGGGVEERRLRSLPATAVLLKPVHPDTFYEAILAAMRGVTPWSQVAGPLQGQAKASQPALGRRVSGTYMREAMM